MRYLVHIKETFETIDTIEAVNEDQARAIATDSWIHNLSEHDVDGKIEVTITEINKSCT